MKKVYPAFGFVVVKNTIKKDEVLNDDVFKDGTFVCKADFPYVWLYTQGAVMNVELNTGVENYRPVGYNNLTQPEPLGTWRAIILEDSEIYCIPPDGVNDVQPPLRTQLKLFRLEDGATTMVPHGTKLFLASGALVISGKMLSGPRQLEFMTGDKEVTANGLCLGILFP